MRDRTPEELQKRFPKLIPGTYKDTSKATARYNCLAFANGDSRKWWESGLYGGPYFWPARVPDTLDGWKAIFTEQGYAPTTDHRPKRNVEKIAIYVDLNDMTPSHVARSDGRTWLSKLGRWQDISHGSLELLEGEEYGMVECILERAVGTTRKKRNTKIDK